MGNLDVAAFTIFDDDDKRIVRVQATDLERNTTYSQDVFVAKVVERRNPRPGAVVVGSRETSEKRMVYVVEATEDEMLVRQSALTSKAMRGVILRLLPGDIADDCWARIRKTRSDEDAKSPQEARNRLIDSFAALGVPVKALHDYLDHDVATCSPAEVEELRGIYAAIKQGETTWHEIVAEKDATATVNEATPDEHLASLRSRLQRRQRHASASAPDDSVTGTRDQGSDGGGAPQTPERASEHETPPGTGTGGCSLTRRPMRPWSSSFGSRTIGRHTANSTSSTP